VVVDDDELSGLVSERRPSGKSESRRRDGAVSDHFTSLAVTGVRPERRLALSLKVTTCRRCSCHRPIHLNLSRSNKASIAVFIS